MLSSRISDPRLEPPVLGASEARSRRQTPKARTTEWREQSKLFEYSSFFDRLKWMFAIPNGGYRRPSEAVMLKRTGVKAGVSDVFLPIPSNGKHGMFIEMKVKPNKPTNDQLEFLESMSSEGYETCVCYSADEAIKKIHDYLGSEKWKMLKY